MPRLAVREVPRVLRTQLTARLFDAIAAADSETDRDRLRERVVLVNATVALSIAHRYHGRGIDADDLDQTAYLTLLVAARRFEPDRGTEFLSFAVPTILGAMRHHFRDHGWTIRVPRRVQEVQRLLDRVDLPAADEPRYGRATVRDLEARLGVPAHDVESTLAARGCFRPTSLTLVPDEQWLQPGEAAGSQLEDPEDAVDVRLALAPLLSALSSREREILRLRFVEDRTQHEVAGAVGLTQTQVSRILTRVLQQLRAGLGQRALWGESDGVGSRRRAG